MARGRRLSPGGATVAVAVVVAAALVALTGCAAVPGSAASGAEGSTDSPLGTRLVREVSGSEAFGHLRALQRIADRNNGNRASPGPGYDASVDYVAGVLRAAGYDVSTPTYSRRRGGDGDDSGGGTTLRNVIAQTRTGSPRQVVMAGAHLDSVPKGPGINDNGTGVAALLELATRLGGSPEVRNAVRFAFWGSEEDDLQGSTSYLEDMDSTGRRSIQLYLNLDMLGSPNAGYFVQGGPGRDDSRSGPPGSERVGRVLTDRFAALGVTTETVDFDGGSDYAAFLNAEIPTGGLLAGADDRKTEAQARGWGGAAGQPFDACYHSGCDRIDNVDPVVFDRYVDVVAGAMGYFAGSGLPPSN